MYTPDDKDEVAIANLAPLPSAGAPMPRVIATENELLLCYETADDSGIAVVTFTHPYAHYFGPPNDEPLNGHPLYSRGLASYGIFEVISSSLVRYLCKMNSVYPLHSSKLFFDLRHFIFTFHDSIFEVIARGVRTVNKFDPDDPKLMSMLQEQKLFQY